MATLVVTRPKDSADRFIAAVRKAATNGFDVILSPLMEIRPIENPMPGIEPQALILTSANGVAEASRRRLFAGSIAWCVGQRTTQLAAEAGYRAECMGETADELVDRVRASAPPGPLLLLRGVHAAGNIAKRLNSAGIETHETTIYDQVELAPSNQLLAALGGPSPLVIPVFSARSARLLTALPKGAAPVHLMAISPSVAEAARAFAPESITIADRPDLSAMVAATVRQLDLA